MLADITRQTWGGINPDILSISGNLYFGARVDATSVGLWKSDGTVPNTQVVKNLGGASGAIPQKLIEVNGTLCFLSSSALWQSDGTEAGTILVKSFGSVGEITKVGNVLYLSASETTSDVELWKSDCTAAGTTRVKDINAGTASSSPSVLLDVAGTVMFFAVTAAYGRELWKSDGTDAGTVLVQDSAPGTSSGSPGIYGAAAAGGVLIYSMTTSATSFELWRSNGTDSGTYMVKDINPGITGSFPEQFTSMGGLVFFDAIHSSYGHELWVSDGTTAGTAIVKDMNPGTGNANIHSLMAYNGALYFGADDATNGNELWKTDGTTNGTVRVKDIVPGRRWSNPLLLRSANGSLFFTASDGGMVGLWKTDGTDAGTELLTAPFYANANGAPLGTSFFVAGGNDTTGTELWKTDGTAPGTSLFMEFDLTPTNPFTVGPSFFAANVVAVNGRAYFYGQENNNGPELWSTNGTGAGTARVIDIYPGTTGSNVSERHRLAISGGKLYFNAIDPGYGEELWVSDATLAGTHLTKEIAAGSFSGIDNLTDVSGLLYFTAFSGLWRTDGTEAGTILLRAGTATNITAVNGRAFFSASSSAAGSELWVSDGTVAGTVQVKDINPGTASSGPAALANLDSVLYFRANDGTNGNELWRSDGTGPGTVLVKDINPGTASSLIAAMTNINGALYFSANDGSSGDELWRSDGTTAGTVRLKDINPGTNGSSPAQFYGVGNVIFFSASDATNGRELWKTDGTGPGTVLIKNIASGSTGSIPQPGSQQATFATTNTHLYFSANDGTHGYEVWVSDGTTEGTQLLYDVFAGPNSPDHLVSMGDYVLFTHNHSLYGTVLWKGTSDVHTWDGGGSTNNWSDAANWTNDTVPQAGDVVSFGGLSTKDATVDAAFAGSITELNITSGYTGTITLDRSLTLLTGGKFSQANGVFDLAGQTFTLGGNLTVTGGSFNANSGTVAVTANSTIDVNGTEVFQNLTIQGASAAVSAGDTIDVTNSLTLNGGTLTGPGTLSLTGNVISSATAASSIISAGVTLGSSPRTVTAADGAAAVDLKISGAIAGTGGLIKTGPGLLELNGSNGYAGATTINEGTLRVAGTTAIPNTSAVVLANVSGATLDLNGTNTSIGSLSGGGSSGGNVLLGAGTLTTGADNTYSIFSGAIIGTGGLTKIGTGSFYLRASNNYDGATVISDGSILVSANNALGSTTGGTTVAANASARLVFERGVNYSTPEPVTINGSGFNGVGALMGIGNATFAGPITLATASAIAAYPGGFTLTLTGDIDTNGKLLTIKGSGNAIVGGIVSGGGGITKEGAGTGTLTATNNYTGATTINAGKVLVTGSAIPTATTVGTGATLGGTGTIGAATASGGTVSPGIGIGILTGSTADFGSTGILRMQVQGYDTPGTSFDRLDLSGTLTTGGTSKLELDLAGLSSAGTVSGLILYGSASGAFTTVALLNNSNNYFACLNYGDTSLDVMIQEGTCGQWVSVAAGAEAVGVAAIVDGAVPRWATGAPPITIASLDSGLDYTHPILRRNIWINQAEIPAAVRSALRDRDGDGRISLRDLNRRINQGPGRIADVDEDGMIDGRDVLRAWSDGIDDDANGYIDDVIGWDFVNDDNDPMDESGHGTHSAGILAEVAPHVEILPMRILDSANGGSLRNARLALDYALAQGVPISSNGWAASTFEPEWFDELKKAESAGHLFVAAAGNGDPSLMRVLGSLRLSNMLIVAASDRAGELARFSNWDSRSVDLALPGLNVSSAMPGGEYAAQSGTSVATSIAAGLAAVLKGWHPHWGRSELVDEILNRFATSNQVARGVASPSLKPPAIDSRRSWREVESLEPSHASDSQETLIRHLQSIRARRYYKNFIGRTAYRART